MTDLTLAMLRHIKAILVYTPSFVVSAVSMSHLCAFHIRGRSLYLTWHRVSTRCIWQERLLVRRKHFKTSESHHPKREELFSTGRCSSRQLLRTRQGHAFAFTSAHSSTTPHTFASNTSRHPVAIHYGSEKACACEQPQLWAAERQGTSPV